MMDVSTHCSRPSAESKRHVNFSRVLYIVAKYFRVRFTVPRL